MRIVKNMRIFAFANIWTITNGYGVRNFITLWTHGMKKKTTECLFLIFANANANIKYFFLIFEHANGNSKKHANIRICAFANANIRTITNILSLITNIYRCIT